MKLTKLRLSWRLGLAFGLVLLLVLMMTLVSVLQLRHIDRLAELHLATTAKAAWATGWRSETAMNLSRGMVLTMGATAARCATCWPNR